MGASCSEWGRCHGPYAKCGRRCSNGCSIRELRTTGGFGHTRPLAGFSAPIPSHVLMGVPLPRLAAGETQGAVSNVGALGLADTPCLPVLVLPCVPCCSSNCTPSHTAPTPPRTAPLMAMDTPSARALPLTSACLCPGQGDQPTLCGTSRLLPAPNLSTFEPTTGSRVRRRSGRASAGPPS